MKRDLFTLAVRFGKRAMNMLTELANIGPEREYKDRLPHLSDNDRRIFDERFRRRWERDGLHWPGDADGFFWTQHIIREVWKGQKKGTEGFQVELSLGFTQQRANEYESPVQPPVHVDWKSGSLYIAPRNLRDLAWLTLLQHSQSLAICANQKNGCPRPYFIKRKPNQRFCSDACALPAQRAFKRHWWAEHGSTWRRARKASAKKTQRKRGK